MKKTIIYYFMFTLLGCESMQKRDSSAISIDTINDLLVGISKVSEVKSKIGEPDSVGGNNWIFNLDNAPRLRLRMENNILTSVSLAVWEGDPYKKVGYLLDKFSGEWTVIKEPMSNPHAGPTICYLEDLKGGKRIRIHGYKKLVERIIKWKPEVGQVSIKKHLYRNVGKEFCIASSCSKVIDPDAWKHNHCGWLEKLVKKTQN